MVIPRCNNDGCSFTDSVVDRCFHGGVRVGLPSDAHVYDCGVMVCGVLNSLYYSRC